MRRASAVFVAATVYCSLATAVADPLDKQAFTASAAELLASAKAAPETGGAIVLRRDSSRTIDADNRIVMVIHEIVAIRDQSGIDNNDAVAVEYSPYYQDRPELRARVVAPDGTSSVIDPVLISEAPTVSDSSQVFSDRRRVEVPLPKLAVGAVIERQRIIRDRQPRLHAGVADYIPVDQGVATRRTIITITGPSKTARVVPRGFAHAPVPRIESRGGVTTWTYDFGPRAPLQTDANVPSDLLQSAYIAVTTAPSWGVIAREYRDIVEQRIAEGTVTLPEAVDVTTPRNAVTNLTRWLHEHVRYTGIELADAEITPWPPAKVIERGFGDCKDTATLLVALLRAANVHADLVILDTGPGFDVDPEAIGLGEFDHAIVRAHVDGSDVWIDATEPDLPAGQLPPRDQGRRGLVAAADTAGLITTPRGSSTDTVETIVRTYHLAESNAGTAHEEVVSTGAYIDRWPGWKRRRSAKELDDWASKHAKAVFGGKPVKLTSPFGLDVAEVNYAWAEYEAIDPYLDRAALFGDIPEIFDGDDDEPAARRKLDYEWPAPHVIAIENRLVVPGGFTMPHPPATATVALGTLTLTTEYRVDGDAYVVTFRLDTGKQRITADELRANRKALRAVEADPRVHIPIERTSHRMLQANQAVEAIAELQRMIALHPKEALHHDLLAFAYLNLAQRAAALREAERGVKLEPSSASAWSNLGWVRRHDAMARLDGADSDRAGALAALRKAIALMPDHAGALEQLGDLLVQSAHGLEVRTADRVEAAAMWRRRDAKLDDHKHARDAALQLFWAGSYADAEAALVDVKEDSNRPALVLAVDVAAHGVQTALDELAPSLDSAARDSARATAAILLVTARRYDDARAVATGLTSLPGDLKKVLDRMQVVDTHKLDRHDPDKLLVRMLDVVFNGSTDVPWTADAVSTDLAQLREVVAESSAKIGNAPLTWVMDLLATVATHVDGDARSGWRIEWAADQLGLASKTQKIVAYAIRNAKGDAVIVASPDEPVPLGHRLRDLRRANDHAAIGKLIGWIESDATKTVTPIAAAIKAEHARAGSISDALVDGAIAMLLARNELASAEPGLRACTGELVAECRNLLAFALVDAERWQDAADVNKLRLDTAPGDIGPLLDRAYTLARSGHTDEAAKLLDDSLANNPSDRDKWMILANRATVAMFAGGWPAAAPWRDRAAAPGAPVSYLNSAAWGHAFYDSNMDAARAFTDRMESSGTKLTHAYDNTVAVVAAEAGDLSHAARALAAGAPRGEAVDEDDWYPIGRIAEQLGLRDDAITAFKRIKRPKHTDVLPSGYDFAQRALTRLHAR